MKNKISKVTTLLFLVLCLLIPTTCKKLEKSMLVSTGDVTNILANSADAPGEIIDLGNGATQHGHYYGKEPNLKTSDLKTQLDAPSAIGGFTSQLSDLEAGTLYYVKAYLTNGTETVFGKEKSFTTVSTSAPQAPTIGTAAAGNTQATVTFTAPGSNGGSVISGYTVTSSPGGYTATGAVSPITVNGLTNGTAYTFTVTATNANGIGPASSASNSVIPSTIPGAPTIGTATAGTAQATITFTAPGSNGGSAITGYTVTSSPGDFSGTGTSSPITVTGLTNGTAYTFTVTATNINGIGPASSATLPVISGTVTDIDGNVYNTVVIGTQTWMASNLKTTKYNDGTVIPNVTIDGTWAALTTAAYCDYLNTPGFSTVYGRLYNWYVVDNNAATKVASNGGKNVCPTGWHVSSDAEWTTLTNFLGGESVAGDKLREIGTSHWASPNNLATNEVDFTALPAGYRGFNGGGFYAIGSDAYWWSATPNNTSTAWYRIVYYNYTPVYRNNYNKTLGYSVRCLQD